MPGRLNVFLLVTALVAAACSSPGETAATRPPATVPVPAPSTPPAPAPAVTVVEAGEQAPAIVEIRNGVVAPLPQGCDAPTRVAVEYGGWPGQELKVTCPEAELWVGALHRAGAGVVVTYEAVTQTDEDRWVVSTALETIEIDR